MGEIDPILLGVPITASIFAAFLSGGIILTVFATILSLVGAVAATALVQLGGTHILGSGVNITDTTLRLTFITTFLTSFYTGNMALGIAAILAMPFFLSAALVGVLTTMYLFGMFGMTSK